MTHAEQNKNIRQALAAIRVERYFDTPQKVERQNKFTIKCLEINVLIFLATLTAYIIAG